jgi:hypothetical protein
MRRSGSSSGRGWAARMREGSDLILAGAGMGWLCGIAGSMLPGLSTECFGIRADSLAEERKPKSGSGARDPGQKARVIRPGGALSRRSDATHLGLGRGNSLEGVVFTSAGFMTPGAAETRSRRHFVQKVNIQQCRRAFKGCGRSLWNPRGAGRGTRLGRDPVQLRGSAGTRGAVRRRAIATSIAFGVALTVRRGASRQP